MVKTLSGIKDAIANAKRILITSQLDPDGDSVGSQLALARVLRAELGDGPEIQIINEVACPERYRFLPNTDTILAADRLTNDVFDVGFVLDGGVDRTGSLKPVFEKCPTRILIDHHKTTATDVYTHVMIDVKGSSTAELIYQFVQSKDWKISLDTDMASLLYVGLVYDTGCFMYALTTPASHQIAATLMEAGIDHSRISETVLMESPLAAKKLLARVLSEMKFSSNGQIAWCLIPASMEADTGASDDDVRASINHLIFVDGVQVALLFKEREDKIKISLRARAGFDVALFARSLDPGGGGHSRAAGCSMTGTIEDVSARALEALATALK